MVRGKLAFKQSIAAHFAAGVFLAGGLLLAVGNPAWHRAGGDKHCGQVAKPKRAHKEARHDLVANAKTGDAVIHLMREGNAGRHGDIVTAEERELHPILALRHPVAHRRRAASDLTCRALFARVDLHALWVAAIGLVGGKHVIVGGDDADIGSAIVFQCVLIFLSSGKGVGEH